MMFSVGSYAQDKNSGKVVSLFSFFQATSF